MSIKSSLKNLVTELGGTSTAKTTAGILGEVAVALGGTGNCKTIESQIDNIVSAKNPLSALVVDTEIAVDEDLLGKVVGDLQEDIAVGNGTITGTVKYVTGYTGFSGESELQSGNYLALHASVPDVSSVVITMTLVNAQITKDPVTLDPDGINIIRVTNKDTQKVIVTATKTGHVPVSQTYTFKGLTLEDEPNGPEPGPEPN